MNRDPTNPFAPLDNPGWLDTPAEVPAPMLAHVLLEAATAKCREHSDTIARLTAKNERLKAALEAYEKHMGEMQRAAERHLTTDRRQDQFVNAMIYMLDGPEQRAVQALTRAALQEPRT